MISTNPSKTLYWLLINYSIAYAFDYFACHIFHVFFGLLRTQQYSLMNCFKVYGHDQTMPCYQWHEPFLQSSFRLDILQKPFSLPCLG